MGGPLRIRARTTLTAMLFSGGPRRAHSIGKPGWDADFRAPVLARYAGGNPRRSADLVLKELRAANRYLLCPDGLSSAPGDRVIRDVLASAADPAGAVRRYTPWPGTRAGRTP